MYRQRDERQNGFSGFKVPFDKQLNTENRWVKLAAIIPWQEFEKEYAAKFSGDGMGAPAKPFRMALGAVIIQKRLNLTDEELVEQLKENPYFQYFIGLDCFQKDAPFDSSMMVHFRKRLDMELMNRVNEKVAEMRDGKKKLSGTAHKEEADEEVTNKGQLLLDATCAPQDIKYPTDFTLLNEAREKTENIIDKLHEGRGKKGKKPRTYRRKARKQYMRLAKQRKKSGKALRKGIRQQLGYVGRNLKSIEKMVENGANLGDLTRKEYKDLLVIQEVYRQQKEMFEKKTHSIPDRIVSISQPHVRPIVRGKAGSEVEFGAKLVISVADGMVRMEHFDWNNYNEASLLKEQIENYKMRNGFYPASVHVDKIYQTRDNRNYCKEHGIRMSGPKLGRPLSDKEKDKKEKAQEKLDANARQPVEGKFGNMKRRYGLDLIFAKLPSTSECEIAAAILVLNLETILREGESLYVIFLFLFQAQILFQRKLKIRCGVQKHPF